MVLFGLKVVLGAVLAVIVILAAKWPIEMLLEPKESISGHRRSLMGFEGEWDCPKWTQQAE